MPKILNFHLPAKDVGRARTFYGDVFGWSFADRSLPDTPYFVAAGDDGGIELALVTRDQTLNAPVPTFEVDRIDDAMARLSMLGGRQGPVRDIPGIGRFGYAIDSEGNTIALLERAPRDGA